MLFSRKRPVRMQELVGKVISVVMRSGDTELYRVLDIDTEARFVKVSFPDNPEVSFWLNFDLVYSFNCPYGSMQASVGKTLRPDHKW